MDSIEPKRPALMRTSDLSTGRDRSGQPSQLTLPSCPAPPVIGLAAIGSGGPCLLAPSW